jgi:hypothetical protein
MESRAPKLQGVQLGIGFPARRGRPTRRTCLERAGQLSLSFQPAKRSEEHRSIRPAQANQPESFEDALQMTFPVRPYTEDEPDAEFNRLFPAP